MHATRDGLARDRRTLHLATRLALARTLPDARVLCVVDQLEEVFTLLPDEHDRERVSRQPARSGDRRRRAVHGGG